MTVSRTRSAIAAAFMVLSLSACTAGGADEVSKEKLQESIKTNLNNEHATSSPVKAVECPGGLKPEVGATVTCTATTESSEKVDVDVRVDSVDGDTVRYSMKPKQKQGSGNGVQG